MGLSGKGGRWEGKRVKGGRDGRAATAAIAGRQRWRPTEAAEGRLWGDHGVARVAWGALGEEGTLQK